MKKIKCLMCKSDKSTVLSSFRCEKNPKLGNMKVVRCDKCGFVFMNPQPTYKELETIYTDSLHERKRRSRLKFLKIWYEKKRMKLVLQEARKINKNPKNILDIGCSNGFFLQLAEQQGLDIYGTEIGKSQISYLKKNVTKNIYLSEKDLVGKVKFDIITAFDVIEHLPDPESFIRNCSRLLNKNGLLIIMTMVMDSWTYRTFKDRVIWINEEHLFYFTKDKLKELLAKYGLKIFKRKAYNNSLLHLGLFVYRLLTGKKVDFADSIIFFARKKG